MSENVNKNIGHATAYGYAKSKGYTGTEEQFAELMASYADVGQTAVDAALAAKASEDAAKASETASEASQAAAATSAGTATTAAQNAAQSAQAAQADADAAALDASQALSAASTAGQKATEAAQSATAAAGSATTAGASATAAQTAQTAAETAQGKAEDAQAAAEAAAQTLVIDPTLTQPNQAAEAKATGDAISLVKSHLNAIDIVDTASGAIASFPDGADGIPVEGLTVQIEPTQSGTGDPSPDNVRPISGRQSVTVWRSGGNIWDEETVPEIINNSGEFVPSSNAFRSKNPIPVTPGQKLYIVNGSNTYIYMKFYNSDGGYVGSPINNRNTEITVPNVASIAYMYFSVGSEYGKTYKHDIAINYPSTITAYNSPDSVTVQLGQTVYGGTVDVTSGEMVVDRAIVDMGTLTWSSPATNIFRTNDLASTIKQGTSPYAKLICSQYKTVQASNWASGTNDVITSHPSYSNGNVLVKDTAYTDAAVFKTAMDGVQLVYELAQPITVQLTPEQLTTVLGQNNVWSDADSVSVDYVADTKLYIEQLTEPDVDMVADANITSGKYFMVGNSLYLATANIASGGTISPGVNCTRTSLAAALNAINA